ncbi:MAG TPA: pantoate--beta-alanine ligase, partial [Nocardioides bacterium]|nr:pantoate--beta-alanine ligase [Nocardioides sp.]
PALIEAGRALLEVDGLDYLEVVDPDSLAPLTRLDGPARALVAGRVGRTRLIDNLQLWA